MELKPHQYSCTLQNKRICIFGPYPPPLGGISVHIERVVRKLRDQQNDVVVVDVTNYRSRSQRWNSMWQTVAQQRPELVYYHTSYNGIIDWVVVCLGKIIFKYKIILIEHSPRHWYARNWLFKRIMAFTIRYIDEQIFIGPVSKQALIDNHIPITSKHSVESSFLPPDVTQASALAKKYPPELWQFIEKRHPIILINASKLVLWNGKDLYGFDSGFRLLEVLTPLHSRIGLVCALAQPGNYDYYQQLKATYGDDPRCFWLEQNQQLWPLFAHVDLFIRPTVSDSEGISISEALWSQIPAIASDVCPRPAGAVVYPSENFEALLAAATQLLRPFATVDCTKASMQNNTPLKQELQ